MKRHLTPLVVLIASLGTCALGCGGDLMTPSGSGGNAARGENGADAPNPAMTSPDKPSGGVLGGTNLFRTFIHVTATATESTKRQEVPVLIEVQVGRNGAPVAGAVVTAGSLGKAVRATEVVTGRHVVEETGYSPWYEVSIETDGAVLKDVRLRAPALHSVSVPSRPSKGQPTLVTWDPSHDSVVDDLQVRVFGWDEQKVTYDDRASDTGEFLLPATALPSRSSFAIQVRRAASQVLAVDGSVAIVDVTSAAETVVR